MSRASRSPWSASLLGALAVGSGVILGLTQGCSDSGTTTGTASTGTGGGQATTTGTSGGATTGSTSGTTTTGTMATGSTTASTNASTSTGMMMGCMTAITGPTRGSAIAVTSDDSRLITVNRDVGSVTVFTVDKTATPPTITKLTEIPVGGEPWQVAINGCDDTAYVVLRKDQKLVEIKGLNTATPAVGASVAVGSEPTSLAITPHNTKIYVSNWVDGTLSVVDPITMTVTSTIDLNATIVATGVLGPVTARPALAHPRGVAITNTGGADSAEDVYATEWYAVRTSPEDATGTNSDHNWKGLLYKVNVGTGTPSTIDLPALADTGFLDAKGQHTGCFPNQVATVTLDSGFAYVTSTCVSPVGPVGVFQKGACTTNAQCGAFPAGSQCVGGGTAGGGVCTLSCIVDTDCPYGVIGDGSCQANQTCKPAVENAKTTTHPGLTIVDLSNGNGTTSVLDKAFQTQAGTNAFPLRVPLLPSDIGFHGAFAYVTAQGADAAFRLTTAAGAVTAVGSSNNNFIDLRTPADASIRLPIGIAMAKNLAVAFVADDGNRDVTVLDLNSQSVANAATAVTTYSSPLPATGSPELSQLRGKRFFTTGLGRWSLRGQGWGSCGACHFEGLSDNITWYFARGPRQTISIDGTFSKSDPTDHRAFNWNAIADEMPDLETNVRGISGGVGAIVSTVSTPPAATDRINIFTTTPPQAGLQGSSTDTANPNGTATPHSVIGDWGDITAWAKTIRSPRAPSNLVAADVLAGKALFSDPTQGNCVGCHSGSKWTISQVFYVPSNTFNDAPPGTPPSSLSTTSWNTALNGFPSALLPATSGPNQFDRVGGAPAFEQLGCIVRPVGTIKSILIPSPNNAAVNIPTGVSPAAVGVIEIRQDMVTGAQGSGALTNEPTTGFNPPSLLGLSIGAPYYHAGNARTLEETFDPIFKGHFQSPIAAVFSPTATQIKQLTAFLLSIDGSTASIAVPAKGSTGGVLCIPPQ